MTPPGEPGVHTYDLSPDRAWAIHTSSRFGVPPTTALVALPDYKSVRTLVDNAGIQTKAAELLAAPAEFFELPIGGGVTLDGWMIKPRGSTRRGSTRCSSTSTASRPARPSATRGAATAGSSTARSRSRDTSS